MQKFCSTKTKDIPYGEESENEGHSMRGWNGYDGLEHCEGWQHFFPFVFGWSSFFAGTELPGSADKFEQDVKYSAIGLYRESKIKCS